MKSFNTPKQLETHLLKVINDVIQTEVKDTIIQIWLAIQKERVYDVYEPEYYRRREHFGGLADEDNIIFTDIQKFKTDLDYTLENITTGAGDAIGQKINALIEGKAGFAGDPATGMAPRPYTEEAVEIINTHPSAMKLALTRGFARHGIQITVS